MTTPRRRRCSKEGLWRVTLLLSLAGLRLDSELAPPALRLLSDKQDVATQHQQQQLLWLRDVRALGTPRFPATRVDAWLVQDGGDTPPPAPCSGASRGGRSNSQEEAPEPPSSSRDHCLQQQGRQSNKSVAAATITATTSGESSQRCREGEDGDLVASHSESQVKKEDKKCEKSDQADWKERENTDSSSLNHRSATESSLPLEGYFPLLTSLTENALEDHLLGNLVPINSGSVNFSDFSNTVDLTQAISHNVSLQDAMMMGTNHTTTVNAERNNLEIQDTLSLNSSLTYSDASLINGTNLLGIFTSDNCCRNPTSQDFFMGLDASGFDEINMALAIEEDFDPVKASLFEEPDSDSGLSLNLDHSNSFVLTCDSDAESATGDVLGAVGGCCQDYSKHCHMDYQGNYDLSAELLVDVFHNHTYNQIPQQLAPSMSDHCLMWPEKSNKARSRNADADRNQNHDEYRAKALRIPFSVNDIVTLPVDSFNSMLSRYHLTDNQLSLIRDIRRRGKNKVAAQNCRKRKLDAIMNLESDVCHLQAKKESLKKEKVQCNRSINLIKQKLDYLYWEIFSRLRDDQGSPVNPGQYTLHCCKNGSVLVVPGTAVKLEPNQETPQNKK